MAARKRGREPGFNMSEAHRVKIQNGNILNALIEHVQGKRDMSATQVTAGLGLLRKVLPDLQSIEGNLNVTHSHEDVLNKLEESATAETVTRDAAYH